MQNSTLSKLPPNLFLIGCGGIGSWLFPALLKVLAALPAPPNLWLVDGDTLEEKNLDRQLFPSSALGSNKAEALARTVGSGCPVEVMPIDNYLTFGSLNVPDGSLFLSCADNHAARACVLRICDESSCQAIIGGNEYTDAQAYYYWPKWKDTPMDPRVRYPAILTSEAGDPTRPEGCTGLAQLESPQLSIANYSAANFMQWLLWFWWAERLNLEPATEPYWPVEHNNTFTRFNTILVKDCQRKE